jgi:hypothetical protein
MQRALGGRDARHARICFHGHAQCARGSLKDGFQDVMRVSAVMSCDVKVHQRIRRYGLPEFLGQRGIEAAELFDRDFGFPDEERAAAEIEGYRYEGFIHRKGKVPVTADTGFVAKSFSDRLAKADTDVFNGVVRIHVQIALRFHIEIDEAVAGEQVEHVIEKADARVEIGRAGSIQVELQFDLRFRRFPADLRCSRHSSRWYNLMRSNRPYEEQQTI